jgi:hypothetical protein
MAEPFSSSGRLTAASTFALELNAQAMKTAVRNWSNSKTAIAVGSLNALFLFGNGLIMLIFPAEWYDFVPGVPLTGPFNQHFVRDIGLIQMFLGAMFALGMVQPANRLVLWVAATSWLTAHAVLHFWEVSVGICHPSALGRDFPAVTLPALIGIVLTVSAWRANRHAGVLRTEVSTPAA